VISTAPAAIASNPTDMRHQRRFATRADVLVSCATAVVPPRRCVFFAIKGCEFRPKVRDFARVWIARLLCETLFDRYWGRSRLREVDVPDAR
jgi:hypothetical protein